MVTSVDSKTHMEIMAVLGEFAHAFSKGDDRNIVEMYVSEPNVVAYGPGLDDKWVGREAIAGAFEREFKNFPESDIEFVWASIAGSGDVAWVAADCKSHVKIDHKILLLDGRFTAVLERRNGRWRIAHSHLSFPAAF